MKVYVTEEGFRMVGKAWEVRSKLKELSQAAGSSDTRVSSMLPRPAGGSGKSKERKGRSKP